jgi:hypothetical protein
LELWRLRPRVTGLARHEIGIFNREIGIFNAISPGNQHLKQQRDKNNGGSFPSTE